MNARKARMVMIALPLLCLLALGAYYLPPLHERLAPRIENLITRIKYAINPPEEVVFVPQEQPGLVETIVEATLAAARITATPSPTPTVTPLGPTDTPQPTLTSTPSPTALPAVVRLEGFRYEDQHGRWNYCGPANLSMALNYWGWEGDRDVVGQAVKTNDKDKNVMPYELQNFVLNDTEFGAIFRYGGDFALLKLLLANGFPVLAEKGYYTYDFTGKYGWLGHYQFVSGYDDEKGVVIVQDTYIPEGENHEFTYEEFQADWRPFNYLFMVIYPYYREAELNALLGNWLDEDWASQYALGMALGEVETLEGIDQYFAAFNIGTSHVALRQYVDASYAYDYAFQVYAALPDDNLRPYRMMWYQTGPYFAYYYSARYQDAINLANATFETISEPVLEETFYWRGMARLAIGETDGAVDDLRQSLHLHPGFEPALYQLGLMGVEP
ncbi:MAG: C39 family peptidase [Anaerolineales bacterium]|nr:C39 family peptidase [Anaerolineales bacterium]